MDYLYLASALAIFVAVALLLEGLHVWWHARYGSGARRLERRLRGIGATPADAAPEASLLRQHRLSANPTLQGLLGRFRLAVHLGRMLAQSGASMNVVRFCLVSLAAGVLALAILILLHTPGMFALAAAGGACALPWIWLHRKRRLRLGRIEQQMPEALELMSRTLRAGHALSTAIKTASDELPLPLAAEFRIVFDEVSYGVPMPDALKDMTERMPGSDVAFFVVATLIQRETGGNLAELLDTIAKIIRERLKLFEQVQVYSAEGRLSAWILGLLPIGLAAVLYMVNPSFMQTLWTDPAGIRMLIAVVVLMVVGVIWMRSVIRIRV